MGISRANYKDMAMREDVQKLRLGAQYNVEQFRGKLLGGGATDQRMRGVAVSASSIVPRHASRALPSFQGDIRQHLLELEQSVQGAAMRMQWRSGPLDSVHDAMGGLCLEPGGPSAPPGPPAGGSGKFPATLFPPLDVER